MSNEPRPDRSDTVPDQANMVPVERIGLPAEVGPSSPSLEDLIKTAEPLIKAYLERESMMHAKSIELEKDIVVANAQQARWMMVGMFSISAVVLAFAGALFWVGRPDAGISLIQLIAAIVGAGFGGYGIAKSRMAQGEGG